jgi:hypothetical protein
MLKTNFFRLIYWLLVSWLGGLAILLMAAWLFSANPQNEPSLKDAMGFGGALLMASLISVPFLYLPLLWTYRKLNGPNSVWFRTLLLVLVGNIPIFILLMVQYEGRMSLPEAWLFLVGIVSVSVIFGLVYRFKLENV